MFNDGDVCVLMSNHSALPDDGKADVAGYNIEIEQLGYPKWFDAPWLFIECYLYRYIMFAADEKHV